MTTQQTWKRRLLLAVLIAGSVVGVGNAAWAGPPDIGVETGGNPGGSGGSGGGGGGGSSSGGGGGSSAGGGGSGPVAPPQTRVIRNTVFDTGRAISAGCAPTNDLGDTVIGRTLVYRVPIDTGDDDLEGLYERANPRYVREGLECWYPPRWTESTRTCILDSTASIVQVQPQRRSLDTAQQTTRWGAGDRSIAACQSSTSRLALNASLNQYGRYEAEAVSRANRVTIRTYVSEDVRTGRTPAPEIRAIGSVYTLSPDWARAELTCEGYRDGWSTRQYSFTEDDCGGGGSSSSGVQCLAPGTPSTTWRGNTGSSASRQVMGSGEPARITWARPQVTGSAFVAVTSAQHRLALQGAPWRNDLPVTGNLLSVAAAGSGGSVLKNAEGTGWRSGDEASYDVSWYGATLDSTRLHTEYDYKIDVRRQSIRITGLSEDGRTFLTERIDVVLPSRITCQGAPVSVDALRIIQDVAP